MPALRRSPRAAMNAARAWILRHLRRTATVVETAEKCRHCKTVPVVKRITTTVRGAKPVLLGLCDCDWRTCPNGQCKRLLRGLHPNVSRCPHCDAWLK